MVQYISSSGTKKNALDFSRPAEMFEGDKIFNKLTLGNKVSTDAAVNFSFVLLEILSSVKFHNLDTYWDKFEKTFNDGKTIKTGLNSDISNYLASYSLFYNALNSIDQDFNSQALSNFRYAFNEASDFLGSKIFSHQDVKAQRKFARIGQTIETRLKAVLRRFNNQVDDKKLPGPKLDVW